MTQRWICGLGLEPYHEELVMEHSRMRLGCVKASKQVLKCFGGRIGVTGFGTILKVVSVLD